MFFPLLCQNETQFEAILHNNGAIFPPQTGRATENRIRNVEVVVFFVNTLVHADTSNFFYYTCSSIETQEKSPDAVHQRIFVSELGAHAADALLANGLSFVEDQVICVSAKDAAGLIFPQNHGVSIHENLNTIFLFDTKRPSQFDWQNNSPQFVNLTNDTS